MNILMLAPTFRPSSYMRNVGGGEISNRMLLAALVLKGHRVTVAAVIGGAQPIVIDNGITIHAATTRTDRFGRVAALGRFTSFARQIARAEASDIILSATSALPAALAVSRDRARPAGAFIRAFENFSRDAHGRVSASARLAAATRTILLGAYGETALRRLNFVLPNSEFMQGVTAKVAPSVASHVVYPPIDLSPAPARLPRHAATVVMVGTGEHKGTRLFEALAARLPMLRFRMVGVPRVDEAVSVTANLTKVGWTDIDEEFRHKADIVLVPSLWEEPFGRVAIEALASGAIVLASNIGGLPEALDYQDRLLLQPDDVDAWEARLRDVLAAPKPYRDACDIARSHLGTFSLDTQASVLEQALLGEIARHSSVQH